MLWLPLVALVGGLAVVWTGVSMAAVVNRSVGLFPGRVVATDVRERFAADVAYTGPDGVTRTETFEHTPVIVAGSLLTPLGAGGTVLLFMWHRGVRLDVKAKKWQARFEVCLWWLSRWR